MPSDANATALDDALAGRKVVVLFHSTLCPFCRAFAPVFRRLTSGGAPYQPVEVLLDQESPFWSRFAIEAVPTVIFFDSAHVTGRVDAQLGVGIDEPTFRQALEGAP